MQDEIIKHSKKAYQKMKSPQHTWTEKLKEVSIEILIIVFAVSLSIWLHGWSEHRHQQQEVKAFLADLVDDLKADTASMHRSKDAITASAQNLHFIANLNEHILDSLDRTNGSLGFNSNLATTKFNNGNYEGFKSSGKIGTIEQKELKKLILKYYQETTPNVVEIEKLSQSQFSKIVDYMGDSSENDWKAMFLNKKFKLLLNNYIDYSKGNEKIYEEAIHNAEQILSAIEKKKKG